MILKIKPKGYAVFVGRKEAEMKITPYKNQIEQIIQSKKEILGIAEAIRSIKVSKLGMGENNISLLATINNKIKLVFRIGLRKKNEKNMRREFESLKIVPKGFGPIPLYFGDSKRIIPKVYSILSYIEGKHINKWGDKHLQIHAKKLAQLHKKKYSFCGTIYEKHRVFDLYKRLLKEIEGYRKDSPGLFKDPDIKLLVPKIKDYIKKHNHLFTSLKRFSMIHADPCSVNILFNKDNISYIDWEWLAFGDNAADVAMIFDEYCAQPPWKIKLTGKRLNKYLNAYLKGIKDRTLKQRVRVWTTYYNFTDVLFFKWKLKHYEKEEIKGLPKKHYKKCGQDVLKSLKKRLRWQ